MATGSNENLRIACRRLRNADPQLWSELIKEMEVFAGHAMVQMTNAPKDFVFEAQGIAKAAQALLRIFSECHLEPGKKPGA